jgi:hypothetical protein
MMVKEPVGGQIPECKGQEFQQALQKKICLFTTSFHYIW